MRAFNAISYARMAQIGRGREGVGMPIAGEDAGALEVAATLIREAGFEPVRVGGLAMGRHLVPGTALAGEHSPAEIRRIAATLQ